MGEPPDQALLYPTRGTYASGVLDPLAGRMRAILLNIAELAPLEEVASRLADAARELTDADYAAIGVYDARGSLTRFVTVGMRDADIAAIGHFPRGHGLLGEFARDPALINIASVKQHPRFTGFPAGHPPIGPFLGVPVVYGARVIGALYLGRTPGGSAFGSADEEHLEALAPYAAIAMANAIRLDDERRRAEAAEILASCANAFQTAETERQVGRALGAAIEQLFPDYAFAVAFGDASNDGGALEIVHNDDDLRSWLKTTLAGPLESGRQRIHGALDADDVILQGAGDDVMVRLALRLPGEETLSMIDEGVLQQLSEIAAVGIAAGRRREAESTLERYAIRDAIARDLHDDLIQAIYAIGLGMRVSSEDPGILRERLDNATAELNEVIRDLRAYIAQLSRGADGLTSTGLLVMRIEALVRGQSNPRWEYTIELGDEPLGSRIERQLYLIVREAVSNVHRHAAASTAWLTLERRGRVIYLEIRDDGRGFDRRSLPSGTVGLRSLEERVADIGGSVIIESAAGEGTRISATFPVPEDSDDE